MTGRTQLYPELTQFDQQPARRGVRLADMTPDQIRAVADHADRAAAAEWWRAQGCAQRGQTVEADARMAAYAGLHAQAAELRSRIA